MSTVMKSRTGKYYEVNMNMYRNGIGVETDVYYDRGEYLKEYCIDEANCGRALLTCGNAPICWLPENELYYEGRKNRVRPIARLCRWLSKKNITDAVKLLEVTGMAEGEKFSGGCEVPCLREVNPEQILLRAE